MASAPKRRRVREALRRRAESRRGTGADPVEAVYDWIRDRGTLATLAKSLEAELGEAVSASWLKFVVARLAPDAKAKLATLSRAMDHLAALRKANASSVAGQAGVAQPRL